jgi:RpiB/LacA/LacB family sugar-phosphate isomerase
LSNEDPLQTLINQVVEEIVSELGATPVTSISSFVIALGSDHGGFQLKVALHQFLIAQSFQVIDCGTFDEKPVDYPDVAYAVAGSVCEGRTRYGIIIDGTGIGSCMVANKIPGVRAAMCYDATTAQNAREHNDANVLTLGSKLIDLSRAQEIVGIFLKTECREPRHLKRVDKMMQIERRYLRK